jgi:hypothetical protein
VTATPAITNSVIWSVWTMPTAALQLLTMPSISVTFVLACGTASLLLSTSRGDQKVPRPP